MRLRNYVWLTVMIVVVTMLVMLLNFPANAAVLRGNGENCAHLGKVMAQTSYYASSGVPQEQIREWVEAGIKESMGNPKSIVEDEEDAKFVRQMLDDVLKMQGVHEHQVITYAVQRCMGKSV